MSESNQYPADENLLVDALGIQPNWRILWLDNKAMISPSLPYLDKEFDIAICRNMLQQMDDPITLCNEISRVAMRGFIEIPSSFNEFMYGRPEDLWLCSYVDGELVLHPKAYIRHPLAHVGRKLHHTDASFRQTYEYEHRSLFFIQKYWEGSLAVRIEMDSLGGSSAFNSKDPVHLCVSWLDLALNGMTFDIPELDEDIKLSLLQANTILPGNKICIAVTELYNNKATSDKKFYSQLVTSLRQQNLEQVVRKADQPISSHTSDNEMNRSHYGILKAAYPPGMSHPLVSVVIRTYNRPELLKRCLTSLNEQIYSALEIIVVNDGGEEISHILEHSKYPCQYIRHAINIGKAAALNSGLRLARGVYINILDDDDLVYPDHIALLVQALHSSDRRVAYTDSYMSIETQIAEVWRSVSKKLVYSQPHDPQLLLRTNYLPVLCVMFERLLLNECGYIDERFEVLEDWDLWIRLAQRTEFYHINQVTSEYTQRAGGDNATQELAALFDIGRKRILQKYRNLYNDGSIPEPNIMPKQYRSRLLSMLFTAHSPDQIHTVIKAFVQDFQDVPWAELVIAHHMQEDEINLIVSGKTFLSSDAIHFISLEDIEDIVGLHNQFDFIFPSSDLVQQVKDHHFFGHLFRFQRKEPLISLIVLSKNQLDYTRLCVESIFKHTTIPFELILVDNGSTDGTRAYFNKLAAAHSHVKLILNVDNKGYGGGNNQGISYSTGDLVVIMNNDIIVTKDWIQGLVQALKSNSHCGIVGPVSNYVAAPQLVQDPLYTVDQLDTYAVGHKEAYANQTMTVDRVIGYCMMVRREVIEAIGGFDLLYEVGNFEDDDFCIRAWLAGYECAVARDVFIHHFGSTTFMNDKSLDYELIYNANFMKFIGKWNIAIGEKGDYSGWAKSDIPVSSFHSIDHYCPLVPDRTITSLLQQANELFQRRKFSECESTLLQCLAIHGEQPVVRYNLLVNYMQHKNIKKAGDCFKFLDEMMVDIGYLKVIWYVWQDHKEDAEKLLGRLLNKFPSHPQLLAAQNDIRKDANQDE